MKSVGLKFLVWGLSFFMRTDVWQCVLDAVKRMEQDQHLDGETKKAFVLRIIREELADIDHPLPKLINLAIEIAVLIVDPPKR